MRTSNKHAPALGASAIFSAIIAALTLLGSVAEATPTISGSPRTAIRINSWYSFVPSGSDAKSTSALRYSIINRPNWAQFSVYSGRLEGKPATGGTWSNIRITVRSSTGAATLPAFAITASKDAAGTGGSTSNRAPTVSGTPVRSVSAGNSYVFSPTGADPEGRALVWSISNLPRWATFSTASGRLAGAPNASDVGTYSNLVITASDGTHRTSLPAFNVSVNSTGSSSGSATLSWIPPTRNANGTTLTNLAGYRIYYGTSPGSLTRTVQVSNAGLTRYMLSDLSAATWYFAVRAYTSSGAESVNSNTVSKVVR